MKKMIMMIERNYHELSMLHTFLERFNYLKLKGQVAEDTFGYDRYMNQSFYHSAEWRHIRDQVIVRDNGCDLGIPGFEIYDKRDILIHHMNPITKEDIMMSTDNLLNPNYLITTTLRTHNAIHYGDVNLLETGPVQRSRNDTCPWRKL